MQIVEDLTQFENKNPASVILALGNFDGVHLGHQKLINHVVQQAKLLGGIPAVFTFRSHPQNFLHPKRPYHRIYSLNQKLFWLQKNGIEICFLQKFDQNFSELSAEDFVEKILVNKIRIKEICMGPNARFGHGREGDADKMHELAEKYGFLFKSMDPVELEDCTVSSSWIRQLIKEGNLRKANEALGRNFGIQGEVVHGDGRGTKIGYPTANLKLRSDFLPPVGVYAVKVRELKARVWRLGVANIGLRPTFNSDEKKPLLEVHILGSDEDIYGKFLDVVFLGRIRDEKKFDSPEELTSQIHKDIQKASKEFKID